MAKLEDGKMHTCNLGDSCYIILRSNDGDITTVHRSKEQQYSFNFPYQCGTNCDLPYDAQDASHDVQHNDIVVMGSDGLFDNLFDEDIKRCVNKNFKEFGQAGDLTRAGTQEAAQCLATYAEFVSY